ncbi:hypothetical protein pb186bvf_014363 [Paramecium bursaria]
MSKSAVIDVYLRVRPTKNPSKNFKLNKDEAKCEFFIPKDKDAGYINNQIEKHTFSFKETFGMETTQDEVFDKVAKDVVDSAIQGYNGTIFAYGQTGSGKTYTMTGNPETRAQSGIIPRTIYYIYDQARNNEELVIDVTISYLEIYAGAGYDLLVAENRSRNLSDLPRVSAMATANGQTLLQGLSLKKAQTEEDALNLLFIGEQNRVISETPKNDASTRSHCIFIIILECRKPGSDVKTVSKLCLVDLSGSERIGKTGVEGLLQKEARAINLSLHFLELVIDCLNKQALGENIHIPYRDSMMTLILKDSLGGNCKTRMVATMSPDADDLDESICTCRFAGRVANIKNQVTRNEAVDPSIIIERLKRENQQLKAELAMLKGSDSKDHLEQYEVEECKKKVEEFLQSDDPSQVMILNDRLKMNECFYQIKHIFRNMQKGIQKVEAQPQNNQTQVIDPNSQEEIKRLKQLVVQRDNEIMILLNLIEKGKNQTNQSLIINQGPVHNTFQNQQSEIIQPIEFPKQQEIERQSQIMEKKAQAASGYDTNVSQAQTKVSQIQQAQSVLYEPLNISNEQLMDRNSALEMFRKSYRKNQAMEEAKEQMQDKIMRSKELALIINRQRDIVNQVKNQIEQCRKDKVLMGMVNNDNSQNQDEERLMVEYNKQKDIYKNSFEELKNLKVEIERIKFLLEKNRDKMQQDFERWLDVMLKQRNLSSSQINDKDIEQKLQQFYKNKELVNKL